MRIGQFTGFYPSRPFWAVSNIDFTDPRILENFSKLMEEEVFQYSDEVFSIKICRDGMIMLRMEALEQDDSEARKLPEDTVRKWGEYLDYLNAFYLLLDSSVINVMNVSYFNLHEITTRDVIRVRYENGKVAGYNVAIESVASTFQMGRSRSSYAGIPIQYDSRISMRYLISLEAISGAVDSFRLVVSKPGVEKVLASFTKSIAEYKVGNYETSIILAWFISEQIISDIWNGQIASLSKPLYNGQQRINRDRRDYLKSRDFPVGVVSNMLELWDLLPFDLFKDVDTVRGFRNKIVHEASKYTSTAKDAQLAIETARKLFMRSNNIDFQPSLGFYVIGL